MKTTTHIVRSGYDGKQCFVHARCCTTPSYMLATAQYLDVSGMDSFSGLYSTISKDGGKTWSEFKIEDGLAPITGEKFVTVPCDITPMYHKSTGKVLLLGHTADYPIGSKYPTGKNRKTPYSVWDEKEQKFSRVKFVEMPEGYENCGNGSGQSLELPNGELLIPVYFYVGDKLNAHTAVMRASFDGETVTCLEIGPSLTVEIERGLGEPSIICHEGVYYLTMRNDECAMVAKSTDGLNYTDLRLWMWNDGSEAGSILQSYNTQQHWMQVNGELYLVYTRRGADNDHVFRHRAPLFAAKVDTKKLCLIKDTEFVVVPERGARLGNFDAYSLEDGRGVVMAAEWMQPIGCEKYGSDNSIYLVYVEA